MKFIKHAFAALAAACLVLAGPVAAQGAATNAIEAINAGPQGADIVVRIDLKAPPSTAPTGFSVANPAKIALDFPSTANALGKNALTLNEGDLRSANVVQVGDRTRLVLNLVRSMNYSTRVEGNTVYVVLKPLLTAGDTLAQRVTRFADEAVIGKQYSIQDIAFRRGKDAEGRVVVDLNQTGAGIDIRQQGKSLIVDFLKTSVPEHLRRKLDVTDFGTPVTSVETKQLADGNVRMTITPHGLWEHNAYQSENQFVVEVKRIIEDPNKLVQGTKTGYQGPRVSINYQNGDVRALLRLMAEELGLNTVISETVTGTTTLVLKDVPADQVIDIIFQQKGLDMRKKGNIMLIAPRDELATREKLDFEARQQISDLEPLKTEQFILNYQKAQDIQRLLNGLAVGTGAVAAALPLAPQPGTAGGLAVSRILSKRGTAVADPMSNILFVSDTPAKLEEVRAFIKAVDVASRQVLIEARVVEATDSFQRDLGTKLGFLGSKPVQLGGSGVNLGGGQYGPTGQTSNQALSTGFGGFGDALTRGAGQLAFSLFNSSLTRILNLEVAALQVDGKGKIVSSPRVVTANNVKAKIEDGTEIPVVTPGSANNPPTVTFKNAKLSLEVTPQITPDGTVRMKLIIKKEEPDYERTIQGNPPIKSATVENDVLVENGGTVVIGGVFINKSLNKQDKVPWLGDIPALGWLFKFDAQLVERRELLFFITPRIISDKLNLN